MILKTSHKEDRWLLLGIPILFLIGSLFHFLYQLSGNNFVVGAIAATNESVWEHNKMILVPVLSWWFFYYLCKRNVYRINRRSWFTGMLVSLISSLMLVPLLFYFYTNAFGIEYLLIDILILFVALLFGQLLGLHIYHHSKGCPVWLSLLLSLLIILFFIIFTYKTPHLPIFKDTTTNLYGIP